LLKLLSKDDAQKLMASKTPVMFNDICTDDETLIKIATVYRGFYSGIHARVSSTSNSQDESFYPSDGECVLDFVHIDSVDAGQSVESNGASGREGDGGCLQTCSWQLAASRITAHPV
jgi:hypothetical protein